jgi:hypothetical protein
MEPPVSFLAMGIVLFTAWTIYSNSIRIQRKFNLSETVRLDDLTTHNKTPASTSENGSGKQSGNSFFGRKKATVDNV